MFQFIFSYKEMKINNSGMFEEKDSNSFGIKLSRTFPTLK